MSLDDLVNVAISASSSTPSKPGFGTILIAAQKVPVSFTSRVKTYGSLKEMTDAGFLVTDAAYLCASVAKAQDPTITNFKVGKRLLKTTQTITLKCKSFVEGDVYHVTVAGHVITRTVPAASSANAEATAIAALIDALTEVAASATADTITITATGGAGVLFDVKDWSANLELRDTTADPGIATDLAAIIAADNDWYGLALDYQSPAEIKAANAWVEANKKLFPSNSSDFDCEDPAVTTDPMSDAKSRAYVRSGVLYSRSQLLSYSGAGLMAKQFAGAKPGEDTWAYKTIADVPVDTLTAGTRSAILNKNGNVYESVSNVNITQFGTTGSGEYFDITRFSDWQKAEIQFRVFTGLVNNKKIAYTDAGGDLVASLIKSALIAGEEAGGLEKGSSTVTVPKVAAVDPATRALRKLTGITFTARYAGAIHELDIAGTVTK